MADILNPVDVSGGAGFNWATAGVEAANNFISSGINIYRDWKARQWQEKMMDKQNEYNLPINQRKRLEEAGINPNLAFGSSASGGISASPPGTPTTHDVKVNLGEYYLHRKQVQAQVNASNASSAKQFADAQSQEMQNQIMITLFDKILKNRELDEDVKQIKNEWQLEHGKRILDIGLASDEAKLDAQRLENLWTEARTNLTNANVNRLLQEMEHLEEKYRYEEGWYKSNINPYETSTTAGFFRMALGVIDAELSKIFSGYKSSFK